MLSLIECVPAQKRKKQTWSLCDRDVWAPYIMVGTKRERRERRERTVVWNSVGSSSLYFKFPQFSWRIVWRISHILSLVTQHSATATVVTQGSIAWHSTYYVFKWDWVISSISLHLSSTAFNGHTTICNATLHFDIALRPTRIQRRLHLLKWRHVKLVKQTFLLFRK